MAGGRELDVVARHQRCFARQRCGGRIPGERVLPRLRPIEQRRGRPSRFERVYRLGASFWGRQTILEQPGLVADAVWRMGIECPGGRAIRFAREYHGGPRFFGPARRQQQQSTAELCPWHAADSRRRFDSRFVDQPGRFFGSRQWHLGQLGPQRFSWTCPVADRYRPFQAFQNHGASGARIPWRVFQPAQQGAVRQPAGRYFSTGEFRQDHDAGEYESHRQRDAAPVPTGVAARVLVAFIYKNSKFSQRAQAFLVGRAPSLRRPLRPPRTRPRFAAISLGGRRTVFNIHGNDYRLIARVNYRTKRVFILHILTHAAYERGEWKK